MDKKYFLFAFIKIIIFIEKSLCQSPNIKRTFDTKSFSAGQTATADIDEDGKLELVFGCYRNDGSIYALNSEDGTLLWSYFPQFDVGFNAYLNK